MNEEFFVANEDSCCKITQETEVMFSVSRASRNENAHGGALGRDTAARRRAEYAAVKIPKRGMTPKRTYLLSRTRSCLCFVAHAVRMRIFHTALTWGNDMHTRAATRTGGIKTQTRASLRQARPALMRPQALKARRMPSRACRVHAKRAWRQKVALVCDLLEIGRVAQFRKSM